MKKVYLPIQGEPIAALLSYLHSKMKLTDVFEHTIVPMLEPMLIEKEYHCQKIEGIMQTAYWIHSGYGFVTVNVNNSNNKPQKRIVDVFGPGKIMLHADGFFNNEDTVCDFWITSGTTAVPFTQQNFADLNLSAPNVAALANCILSENATLGLIKSCMPKMQGKDLIKEMVRIFRKEIWQHFSQAQLADYTGLESSYLGKLKKNWMKGL